MQRRQKSKKSMRANMARSFSNKSRSDLTSEKDEGLFAKMLSGVKKDSSRPYTAQTKIISKGKKFYSSRQETRAPGDAYSIQSKRSAASRQSAAQDSFFPDHSGGVLKTSDNNLQKTALSPSASKSAKRNNYKNNITQKAEKYKEYRDKRLQQNAYLQNNDKIIVTAGELQDRTHEIEKDFLDRRHIKTKSTTGSQLRQSLNFEPVKLSAESHNHDELIVPVSYEQKDAAGLLKLAEQPRKLTRKITVFTCASLGIAGYVGGVLAPYDGLPVLTAILGIVSGYLALSPIHSMQRQAVPGQIIKKKDAPELYKQVDYITERLNVAAVERIRIQPGMDIECDNSKPLGLSLWNRKELSIGSLLFAGLEPPMLIALMIRALVDEKTHAKTPAGTMMESIKYIERLITATRKVPFLGRFFLPTLNKQASAMRQAMGGIIRTASLRTDTAASLHVQSAQLARAITARAVLGYLYKNKLISDELNHQDPLQDLDDETFEQALRMVLKSKTGFSIFEDGLINRLKRLDVSAEVPVLPPDYNAAQAFLEHPLPYYLAKTARQQKAARHYRPTKADNDLNEGKTNSRHLPLISLNETDRLDEADQKADRSPDEAIAAYRYLLQQMPNWTAVKLRLGQILFCEGHDEGVELLLEACLHEPSAILSVVDFIERTSHALNIAINPDQLSEMQRLCTFGKTAEIERTQVNIHTLSHVPYDHDPALFDYLIPMIQSTEGCHAAWVFSSECTVFTEIPHYVLVINAFDMDVEYATSLATHLTDRLVLPFSMAVIIETDETDAVLQDFLMEFAPFWTQQ
jgi:hypothetical protein